MIAASFFLFVSAMMILLLSVYLVRKLQRLAIDIVAGLIFRRNDMYYYFLTKMVEWLFPKGKKI
jgi:hypothetical protein